MIVTAKSVIFDITDNWGDSFNVGIRSVEFWLNGVRHDLLPADFSAYATSFLNDDVKPECAFDTSVSKVGSALGTSWSASSPTSQRLICVFNNPIQFDEIRISNFHHLGQSPGVGARTTVTTISSDAVSDTTYKAGILNSSEIFNGVLEAHVEDDVTDEQSINPSFDKVAATIVHASNWRQLQPALSYPAPTHINTLKPFPLELPYRDPVTGELGVLYLADTLGMLVPINIADINLSGNAGCYVQLSISPVYLDAIAGSAPPYSIRDGHGNRVYSIPDIEWSMYSGAKNTGLVVTGRTTADRQRAPHHRSVPAPKSLSPTPQHQIAHIPGAWDIVPEDTVSAGGLFVSVVDSVAIHVERGNSRSTVYG